MKWFDNTTLEKFNNLLLIVINPVIFPSKEQKHP